MRPVLIRIATWLVAFLVGAVFGTAGTVSHSFAPLGLPVGLVLGVVGLGAMLVGIRLLDASRWSALAAGLGAAAATLVLSGTGPGGSVIVPNDLLAIVWSVAVPVLVALVVAWPEFRRPAATPAPDDGRPVEAAQ